MSTKTKSSKKLKQPLNICHVCLNIVDGINRTKDAQYFRINNKLYCSLSCYQQNETNKK